MGDAEQAAKKGFEINKADPWSQHALCHVFQYECRFKEEVEFMEECSKYWAPLSSFMNTHNWWHKRPVEVYLNAVGLLLRVHVRGAIHFFEDHLKMLAGYLSDRAAFWYLEWHLDLLILWALACTGKPSEAQDLHNGLKLKVSTMNPKKGKLMQKGLTLAAAAYEYGRGDFTRALELLGPETLMPKAMVGASGEQLDVFNEVWYVMLLNAGDAEKGKTVVIASAAIEVIEKQLKKRGGTRFLWRLLERGYSTLGKQEAETIGEKAKALETAYF
ncbi:hypothetical protein L1987_79565 [Smallanthus sonchifolius]|uniref:Uncharacterized protein n=1 Tax=Smallanthus sonchifolius TaxID=185202 RepID=A0ACB8ZEU3_9ASTR|nr:hypothetical protein L1987_79565 [Smallanthus sonchifolius]